MIAKVRSSTVVGVQAVPIWIEVDIARGLPHFHLVGLPDSSVRESRERVRSALRNSGFAFPVARITVNLAPGNIRKAGAAYDLPIALGILAAQGIIPQRALDPWIVMGELALDGRTRPVRGVLCTAIDLVAHCADATSLLLPADSAHEIRLLGGVRSSAVFSLQHAVQSVRKGEDAVSVVPQSDSPASLEEGSIPHDPIIGHQAAKRALEIALAGGHNALMIGPPGSGKTLLGERLQYILPRLSEKELLEVNRVYSAVGLLDATTSLHTHPPFRSPHHTTTTRTMIGGGTPLSPGEITLAHRGLLVLDEIALFRQHTLQALREPLEQGYIRMTQDGITTTLPSRVSLIGTTNPCPCGWLGDPRAECSCSAGDIIRYRRRLSGPLLDRIDLLIEVGRSPIDEMSPNTEGNGPPTEHMSAARTRIQAARQRQHERNPGSELNGGYEEGLAEGLASLPEQSRQLVLRATDRYGLTGRGVHRLLRVGRTIADLEGSVLIEPEHIAEAASYRITPEWFRE